jgi:hypothetical protein
VICCWAAPSDILPAQVGLSTEQLLCWTDLGEGLALVQQIQQLGDDLQCMPTVMVVIRRARQAKRGKGTQSGPARWGLRACATHLGAVARV